MQELKIGESGTLWGKHVITIGPEACPQNILTSKIESKGIFMTIKHQDCSINF